MNSSDSEKDIAIRIENVSKRFRLYHNIISGPVKEMLFFWKRHHYYKEFMALQDISFNVHRGEVVGIIGPNGAGKSTLLKMTAGLLPVDKGRIEVNGKITALLAHGVGVHPEFTGRENIICGGMILGMSKAEVRSKMESIIEFADIGEFIDMPFRTYSMGMMARLLFSISMSIDPDILIVDEALAAGDAHFIRKSSERIREICESGATILYVSHNLNQIKQLCNRAILIDKGRIICDSTPSDTCARYSDLVFEQESDRHTDTETALHSTRGTGEVTVASVSLQDENRNETTGFRTFEPMRIILDLENQGEPREILIFVCFLDFDTKEYIGALNNNVHHDPAKKTTGKTRLYINTRARIELLLDPLCLFTGHYSLWIQVTDLHGAIYSDYLDINPFFATLPGQIVAREAYLNHPVTISCAET